MQEKVRVRDSPGRCPYCHDVLAGEGKPVVACADCGARQHQGCHAEHGVCSACGSTEALYPRARPNPGRPPEGSRFQVIEEAPEGQTCIAWHVDKVRVKIAPWTWLLLLLFLPLLPPLAVVLGPMVLWDRWSRRHLPPLEEDDQGRVIHRVRCSEHWIEIPAYKAGGVSRIPRVHVGAIRVGQQGPGWTLTLDAGLERHLVAGGNNDGPGLSAPELEWLAERLRAWKAG